jgi:hypothetical protein
VAKQGENEKFYGIVTRYPQDEKDSDGNITRYEQGWITTADSDPHDPDPEGTYEYQFNQNNQWQQPVYTKRDLEWFKKLPKQYHVQELGNRPSRPIRPTPEMKMMENAYGAPKEETAKTAPPPKEEPKNAPKQKVQA